MARAYSISRKTVPPRIYPSNRQRPHEDAEKGIRSAKAMVKEKLEIVETERCINPPLEVKTANQLYGFTAVLDPTQGTIYVDYTGNSTM